MNSYIRLLVYSMKIPPAHLTTAIEKKAFKARERWSTSYLNSRFSFENELVIKVRIVIIAKVQVSIFVVSMLSLSECMCCPTIGSLHILSL